MWGESKQSTSATTSLIYITLGGLIDVWSVVYWFYLRNHGGSDIAYLYVAGFFFTGLVLFLIGLAVGRIGSSARPAETAPTVATPIIMSDAVATGAPAIANGTAAAIPVPRQAPSAAPAPTVTMPPGKIVPNT
ncbi:MAG: hypothetical protein JWN70_3005 [Planctomycetaceae bacterium]|nr:hypothetical protein [Planctomycetaceae bacterium]